MLDRFYQAARCFAADYIVRITCDCPLIDPNLVHRIDLTALDDETYGSLLRNFFDHLSEGDGSHESNAHDYVLKRYGPAIADEVARPFVEKFARCPAEQLDVMVTRLCPLDRLALLSAAAMPSVLTAPRLSQRIAYVDQRDLPADECSSLASFYPRERGVQQIINAVLARLSANSAVSVYCNTSIASITSRSDGVDVTLQDGSTLNAAPAVLIFPGSLGAAQA